MKIEKPNLKQKADYELKLKNSTVYLSAEQNHGRPVSFWFSTTTRGDNNASLHTDDVEEVAKFLVETVKDYNDAYAYPIEEKK